MLVLLLILLDQDYEDRTGQYFDVVFRMRFDVTCVRLGQISSAYPELFQRSATHQSPDNHFFLGSSRSSSQQVQPAWGVFNNNSP